jgi:hypothetical protein
MGRYGGNGAIRRATVEDAAEIASILNHPTVRPTIGPGDQVLDPTALLADLKNILLFDEGGGQFFHWRGPGIYEAHSFYLVRGKDALAKGREAIRLMFEEYGAEKLWRAPPVENRPARWFNRQLGFRSLGIVQMALIYSPTGVCELFEMKGL